MRIKKFIFFIFIFSLNISMALSQPLFITPQLHVNISIQLTTPQYGNIEVKEMIENIDFADYIRKSIQNKTITLDEIKEEKINELKFWLGNATFTEINVKILGIEEIGKPLKSITTAKFQLIDSISKNDKYIFKNHIIINPEIYEEIIFQLILPPDFEIISIKPKGSISVKEACKIITWKLNKTVNLEVNYKSLKVFWLQKNWYYIVGGVIICFIIIIYRLKGLQLSRTEEQRRKRIERLKKLDELYKKGKISKEIYEKLKKELES